MEDNSVSTQRSGSSSWSHRSGFLSFTRTSCTTSFSTQTTAKNSNTEQRTFSMRVFVKAVQDDIPSGMSRVLNALEEAILVELAK